MPNPQNKIVFTPEQHQFLKDNYLRLTNQQLADALGLKITRVRLELAKLNLYKLRLQPWTDEQTAFLIANYRRIGNKELALIFTKKWHKEKGWSNRQINKKLSQLGLKRNNLDLFLIKERNRKNGSFGNINLKNKPKPPDVYFQLNSRTRIKLTPKTNIEQLKERYASRNIFV